MNKKKLIILGTVALTSIAVVFGLGINKHLENNNLEEVKEEKMTEKEKKKEEELLTERDSQKHDTSGEFPENRFTEGVGEEGTKNEDRGDVVDFTETEYTVFPEREEVRNFPAISKTEALEYFESSEFVTMGKTDLHELTDEEIKSLGRYPTVRELNYIVPINIVENGDNLEYWFKYKGENMTVNVTGPDHVLDLLTMIGMD